MTWLLTGGAGYIGAHIVRAFQRADVSVVVLDDLSSGIRENVPADDVYPRGSVALARQSGDPNSNRDQFFLVYKDTTLPKSADGNGYTIFGTVTQGMDIVDKIAAAGINPNDKSSPLAPISILSVDVQPKA